MAPLLDIYLADHHAGSAAGVALAQRAASHGAALPGGEELAAVAREIAEDRRTLEHLMAVLGVRPSRVKVALARLGELVGRVAPNGRLVSRSPLTPLLELEALSLGIVGKRKLWEALADSPRARHAELDFAALAERAERHHEVVEGCRREAARRALG